MRSSSFKGKLILLTILVFLFGLFILVRFFLLDKQNELGELKVVSSPSSNVFVDQISQGKTPLEQRLKVGEYTIKLIPNQEATTTATWQGKVKIYKNAISYVNRELGDSDLSSAGEISTVTKMDSSPKDINNGEVYVESDPNGALVYLDNDEKGVASLVLSEVAKSSHELSVYLPGFFRRTLKINVEPGYRTNVYVKLAVDQQAQDEATKSAEKRQQLASQSAAAAGPTPSPGASAKTLIKIKDTPTGWLRVRSEPSVDASESARVNPGQSFPLLQEQDSWYKIEYETGKSGWVTSEFADKVSQ